VLVGDGTTQTGGPKAEMKYKYTIWRSFATRYSKTELWVCMVGDISPAWGEATLRYPGDAANERRISPLEMTLLFPRIVL
jgi:hypothetical protein